jgi:phosphoribosyl-ATP pyrophosphohydrolase/phosphoribosyl-AMP cyclohydrolase
MKFNFKKNDGLLPAIIQDSQSGKVLMLAYMNEAALEKTRKEGRVTFYSRSRQRLWTKGETSGNYLIMQEILEDCDRDAILIKARPTGPVCHTGSDTCFNENNHSQSSFFYQLENLIRNRKKQLPAGSYTTALFKKGINKIAQKVGEEATETIIEALSGDNQRLQEEVADLIYHLLVLLVERNVSLAEIEQILIGRHIK